MRSILKEALRKKYEGEIAEANANLQVYFHNPVGIGEHPDIVAAVDSEMVKLADAEDKLATLNKYYSSKDKKFLQENLDKDT